MFLNHAELEQTIQLIIHQTHNSFGQDWLLYPGSPLMQTQALPDDPQLALSPLMPAHRSMLFEFCYALEGTVLLKIEQTVYRLQPGQICLIPAGTMHVEMTDHVNTGKSIFFVYLSPGVSVNITCVLSGGSHVVRHGPCIRIDPLMYNLSLQNMSKELEKPQDDSHTMIKCTLLQQLIMLQRTTRQIEHRLTAEEWKESIVREVVTHLNNSPTGTLELNDLAEHCAISANHLNSIFKSVTGKTITSYCSDLRIRKAKLLLETTNLKLRQLAEELGYYDQYHFCKAFKKATGMSPSQYRAERFGK